jgi:transcriptional regulator with XRE-family HTH domain
MSIWHTWSVRPRDLLRNARLRAGLNQTELAARSGVAQAQISRYESGIREPSLAVVQQLVQACGLALSLQLFNEDGSLHELARDQQQLPAMARIASLLHDTDQMAALTATLAVLPELPGGLVLIGAVAAGLRGGPNRLTSGTLEIVPADPVGASEHLQQHGWLPGDVDERYGPGLGRQLHLHDRGHAAIDLIAQPAGTGGYGDLRREAELLPGGPPVAVASTRDLLRIAEASPWDQDAWRRAELHALLDLPGEGITA